MNKKSNIIIKFATELFTSVSIIAIATIIALNLTFVYKIIIEKYNLTEVTGVSNSDLIVNYQGLVKYLENPFIKKLKFKDFAMSKYGEIHFSEVKRIFIMLIYIALIFVIGSIIYFSIEKAKKRVFYGRRYIKNLNYSANILIAFLISLVIAYLVDFSKAFIIFHKIFFRNDYWIFDEKTDPIINALPEDLFMIYGAIILFIILVVIVLIKVVNKKMPTKKTVNI